MVHALHNRVEHETKRTDDQTILLKIPIPTISLDVCFMGGANDARKATIWDIADSSSVSITGTQASPEAGKSSELSRKLHSRASKTFATPECGSNLIQNQRLLESFDTSKKDEAMKRGSSTVQKDRTNQTESSKRAV